MVPRIAATLALAALAQLPAPPGLSGQEAASPRTAFDEILDIEVVNVDVVVVDKDGQPVTGLTAADFALFEDGERRDVSNFYAYEQPGIFTEHHRLGEKVAAADDDRGTVRRIAMLFDLNSLSNRDRDRAVDAAERFVTEKFDGSYEWAVVAYDDQVRHLQPFTADKIRVLASLGRIKEVRLPVRRRTGPDEPMFSEDPATSRLQERVRGLDQEGGQGLSMQDFEIRERVLENLGIAKKTAVAAVNTMRAYARQSGRKSLILISGVLESLPTPLQLVGGSFPGASQQQDRIDPMLTTLQQELQLVLGAIVQTANASGFSIYPMSALGIASPTAPHHDIERRNSPFFDNFGQVPSGADPESAPRMIADGTGGRFFQSTKFYEAFHEIDASTSTSYVLGFRTAHPADRKYHRLRVEVLKEGLSVRAREGYLHLTVADRLVEELSTPLVFPKERGEIPITVTISRDAGEARRDERLVTVSAQMPVADITTIPDGADSLGKVAVYLAIYDREGRLLDLVPKEQDVRIESETAATGDGSRTASFALKLKLKPGTYTFSMTLMDRVSSRFGTALERVAL
jgi:VWFA-related protein